MADRGTIHTDVPLSQVAVGYKVAKYIWQRVLPPVPVDKESDLYNIFGDEYERYYGKIRADKTESQRINSYSVSTDPYICKEHTYNDIVTDRERNKANAAIKPDQRVTQNLMKIVDKDIEVDCANAVFNTANFAGMTSVPGTKWNVDAAGSPLTDVDNAKTLIAKQIGTDDDLVMVIGKLVFDQLKRHSELIDIFKYVQKGMLTEALLAEAFNVKEVIVGKSTVITSKKGQTKTKDFIWGDYCALLYRTNTPAMEEPSWGYTFLHKLFGGLTAMIQKIPVPTLGKGAVQIEASRSYVVKRTSLKAGYLFEDVLT